MAKLPPKSEATSLISGIKVYLVDFNRRLNRVAELDFTLRLAELYREIKSALAHHISLKPIMPGCIAAKLAEVKSRAGLGFVFSSDKPLTKLARLLASPGLRLTLLPKNNITVFKNHDNQDRLIGLGTVHKFQTVLI